MQQNSIQSSRNALNGQIINKNIYREKIRLETCVEYEVKQFGHSNIDSVWKRKEDIPKDLIEDYECRMKKQKMAVQEEKRKRKIHKLIQLKKTNRNWALMDSNSESSNQDTEFQFDKEINQYEIKAQDLIIDIFSKIKLNDKSSKKSREIENQISTDKRKKQEILKSSVMNLIQNKKIVKMKINEDIKRQSLNSEVANFIQKRVQNGIGEKSKEKKQKSYERIQQEEKAQKDKNPPAFIDLSSSLSEDQLSDSFLSEQQLSSKAKQSPQLKQYKEKSHATTIQNKSFESKINNKSQLTSIKRSFADRQISRLGQYKSQFSDKVSVFDKIRKKMNFNQQINDNTKTNCINSSIEAMKNIVKKGMVNNLIKESKTTEETERKSSILTLNYQESNHSQLSGHAAITKSNQNQSNCIQQFKLKPTRQQQQQKIQNKTISISISLSKLLSQNRSKIFQKFSKKKQKPNTKLIVTSDKQSNSHFQNSSKIQQHSILKHPISYLTPKQLMQRIFSSSEENSSQSIKDKDHKQSPETYHTSQQSVKIPEQRLFSEIKALINSQMKPPIELRKFDMIEIRSKLQSQGQNRLSYEVPNPLNSRVPIQTTLSNFITPSTPKSPLKYHPSQNPSHYKTIHRHFFQPTIKQPIPQKPTQPSIIAKTQPIQQKSLKTTNLNPKQIQVIIIQDD